MENTAPHFVVVYSASGKLDGEMIKAFLESAGIPTLLNQESAGSAYGLTIGSLGKVEIWVPANQEDEARNLLAEMENGDLESGPNDENLVP